MLLISEREHFVMYVDEKVKEIVSKDGDPTEILLALADRMEDIRKLMDHAPDDEKDQYCEEYDGFYLFMTLLEDMASAISEGKLPVPSFH